MCSKPSVPACFSSWWHCFHHGVPAFSEYLSLKYLESFLILFLIPIFKVTSPWFFSLRYFNSTLLYPLLSWFRVHYSISCLHSFTATKLVSSYQAFTLSSHPAYHCKLTPKILPSLCDSAQCLFMVMKFLPVFKTLSISCPSHILRTSWRPRCSKKQSSFRPVLLDSERSWLVNIYYLCFLEICITFLSFSFLICEVGIILVFTSEGYY